MHCRNFKSYIKIREKELARPDALELVSCITRTLQGLLNKDDRIDVFSRCESDAATFMGEIANFWNPVSARVKPECILFMRKDTVTLPVLVIEVKRNQSSMAVAEPQGFALAADMNWTRHHFGCAVSQCATPVLFGNGETVQFGASFIIPTTFPAFCMLSRKLNRLNRVDLVEIGWWVQHLAKFILHSFTTSFAAVCEKQKSAKESDPQTELQQLQRGLCLDVEHLFFKHVRPQQIDERNDNWSSEISSHRLSLVRILQVYQVLYNSLGDLKNSVLFPCGTMQLHRGSGPIPSNNCKSLLRIMQDRQKLTMSQYSLNTSSIPMLVYPLLDNTWKNDVPSECYRKSFINQLVSAIQACTACGVVFLDLRVKNIMWRAISATGVEIKLIDYEHVYFENDLIPRHLVNLHTKDCRYNHRLYRQVHGNFYFADTKTNVFFVNIIEAYVNSTNLDDDDELSDKFKLFMKNPVVVGYLDVLTEKLLRTDPHKEWPRDIPTYAQHTASVNVGAPSETDHVAQI